jgi:hypothetical protein
MTITGNSDGRQLIPAGTGGAAPAEPFPDPGTTGMISVRRMDAGRAVAGSAVS